jgi:HAD superfamily hydrolase (TIGR01509 family)
LAQLQALLFDVDGTLADTERDGHREAFNRAFAAHGLDWHWPVALYGELLAVTGGKERIRFFIDHYHPKLVHDGDLDRFIATLHRAKTEHYIQMLAAGAIPLRPGVRRLIDEARQAGLRLAIVTTTTPENVTALLTSALDAGSVAWFEVIAAGDIVPAKKPAADIYLWALAALQLPAAACIAFEDSHNGIVAASAAGLKTIVAINDYTANEAFADAAIVLDHWGEACQPSRVLAGPPLPCGYLDLAMVRQLHLLPRHQE